MPSTAPVTGTKASIFPTLLESQVLQAKRSSPPAPIKSANKQRLSLPEFQNLPNEVVVGTAKSIDDSRVSTRKEDTKGRLLDNDTAVAVENSRISALDDIERRIHLSLVKLLIWKKP